MVAAKTLGDLGFAKIAILHDNTSYAKGLADEAKSLLEAQGKTIAFYDALTPGERDYNAILTKLKSAAPDVIFFTGYYPEAGMLLRQKMEMGWNVPMLGGDATNNPDLVKIAGNQAAEGYMFLSPLFPPTSTLPKPRRSWKPTRPPTAAPPVPYGQCWPATPTASSSKPSRRPRKLPAKNWPPICRKK